MSIIIPSGIKDDYPYVMDTIYINIPKIIHQIYFDFDQDMNNDINNNKDNLYYINRIPERWKNVPDSWKHQNPEWTYMFWNNNNARKLVIEKFPWFLETYDSYTYPIQRVDAIRYMFLYTFGGIYVDMDIFCKKPIDDLFYKNADVYLLRTPNTQIITNCFIGSKKESPFWIYVLKNMVDLQKNQSSLWVTKHITVMYTTGPSMLEKLYQSYDDKYKIRYLPSEFLFPSECNVCADKPCSTDGSYTILLQGSSWCGSDTNLIQFIYCNYHYLLPIILASIIIYIFCAYAEK